MTIAAAALGPDVESLGIALGLLERTAAGVRLRDDFFASPASRVGRAVSDPGQREALLRALAGLLPRQDPAALDGRPDRRYHPLLDRSPGVSGQLYLTVSRAGAGAAATVDLGLAAEAAAADGGPTVTAELPLLSARGSELTPVAASPEAPLALATRVPTSGGGAISASLLLVAPPDEEKSRIAVRVERPGEEPLELDPLALGGQAGRLVAALLQAVLAATGGEAPAPVRLLADHLPGLLGLDDGLPPLPLGELTTDPAAMRRWLASLVTASAADGRSALAAWLEHVGRLLGSGAPVGGPAGAPPTEASPLVLPLFAGPPAVALTAAVRAEGDGTPVLVLGVRIEADGGAVDATVVGDATVLALPLAGTAPARALERLRLAVSAPRGAGKLVAEPAIEVGRLRAGFEYDGASVTPVLELLDVAVGEGSTRTAFDRLDLADTSTLSSAAQAALGNALSSGLGSGTASAEAVGTLLGFGRAPGLDLALFAGAPRRALREYYRALLADAGGWTDLLEALWTLLGGAGTPPVAGAGTRDDPFRVALAHFPGSSGSPAPELALWDDAPDEPSILLRVGLRAAAESAQGAAFPWSASARAELLGFDLPATGAGAVRFLGLLEAAARIEPPATPAGETGVAVDADGVRLSASWRPGAPLAVEAGLDDLTVAAEGTTIPLGSLRLPGAAVDPDDPGLGLGLDPDRLWAAVRLLVGRAAGPWGGSAADTLALLLGAGVPGRPGVPVGLPPLPLPTAGDLRSLVERPLESLRAWLAELAGGAESVADDGTPFLLSLAHLLQALLTDGLPAAPAAADASDPDRAPGGAGTRDDPWTVPLRPPGTGAAELLFWLEPAGPPFAWVEALLARLSEETVDAETLVGALGLLRAQIGGDPLAGLDPAAATSALRALADALRGSDGLVPAQAALPVAAGWTDGGRVAAAHHDLPRSADAAARTLAEIDGWTAGLADDEWAVVLLAPELAGREPWADLLALAGRSAEVVELRRPGVDPALVDLGGVAAASFYEVGLADDGAAALPAVVARLARVVARIRTLKPGAKVVLVAHSYAGVVAARFASANPGAVLGVVALGAPLAPVEPGAFTAEAAAEGVRLVRRLVPAGLQAAPALDRALRHLEEGLDGHVATASGAPRPSPYPVGAFARAAEPLDLGGTPAVAIAGEVEGDLVQALGAALASAPFAASGEPPTHLAYGVSLGLGRPGSAPAGDLEADLRLRLDLGRVPLAPGVEEPDHAAQRIVVRAVVARPGGWLLGDPGDGSPLPLRLRRAELEGSVVRTAAGLESAFAVRLHDAAYKGLGAPVVRLGDPQAPVLLSELVRALAAGASPGTAAAQLVDSLVDLGLVRRGVQGGAALVADAFESLVADAAGYVAARAPALLDRSAGLLGFVRSPGAPPDAGPWTLAHPDLPLELRLERGPWRVTARTTGGGFDLGGAGHAEATGLLRLADLDAGVEARLRLGGLELSRGADGGTLLRLPQLPEPVALHPPDPPALRRTLAPLVPRIAVDAALTALLERLAGTTVGSLDGLLHRPAAWLVRPEALGDGTLPTAERVNALLAAAARAAGFETDAERPLVLPGDLVLRAADTAAGARLTLAMDEALRFDEGDPDGPSVLVSLALALDRARHATPAGSVVFRVPLPGAWQALDLTLGGDAGGPLAFATLPGPGVRVDLLPQVSGLTDLVQAAAQALLPEVLDALVNELGQRVPPPAALADALAVAQSLAVYDPAAAATGFRSRAGELARLRDDLAAGNLGPLVPGAASAIHALLRRALGQALVPAQPTATSVAVRFPDVLAGTVELALDLGQAPPSLSLEARGLATGIASADAAFAYAHPDLTAEVGLRATLDTGAGVVLRPQLDAALAGDGLAVALAPLGAEGGVTIPLAPEPAPPTADDLLRIAEEWVAPLAATLVLREAEPWLTRPLWQPAAGDPPAKTAKDLLVAAGVADDALAFVAVPTPAALLAGILTALTGMGVPLPGGLRLALVEASNRYGLRVSGEVEVPTGGLAVLLRLGVPAEAGADWGEAGAGPTVYVLDLTSAAAPRVAPALGLGGLGAELRGAGARPLVERGGFRIGSVAAHVRGEIALLGPNAFRRPADLAGAVVLEGLGLPLAPSTGDAGNPVAASLLQAGGGGDKTPVNPPLDLAVSAGAGPWKVTFDGKPELRLPVDRRFGPLHVAELTVQHLAGDGAAGRLGVGVDGSVSLEGLQVAVDDLRLLVPLDQPTRLDRWRVDLAGLGLSVAGPALSVAGSLLKAELADGTIEYRGGLAVSVGGRGFSGVGAYARPGDNLGRYTSLFVFVSVPIPLGGPPYLFVLGLAGGAGYNRRLLVPRDPASVPAFPLVAAMEGGGHGGPLQMLDQIAKDIPPSRGGYWMAAGVKFTTFELIRTTALAYAAIDRNVEVGLLGLMRMALPSAASALVNVELALAARYSTADEVLSVRAALTRNSWLLSRDCQLTGGFAFVTWFRKPEALLTIGGYPPGFQRPGHYPAVDRVGFHWAVGGGVVVKGEAYFALTHAALMFGGRLEASYDVSPIRVWFVASLNVIVQWDPFSYAVDAGVSVGASFRIRVCFIKCATIKASVSLGATVRLQGPPLHGRVTVGLPIGSVTVQFGRVQPQSFLTWDQTRSKYLGSGSASAPGTRTGVLAGIVAGPGGEPPNGSEGRPWAVGLEFAVRAETRMPATRLRIAGRTAPAPVPFPTPDFVDVVPAGGNVGRARATFVLVLETRTGAGAWTQAPRASLDALVVTPRPASFPGGVWKAGAEKQPAAPMIRALGLVDVAAPLAITERTGSFGPVDVPFSKLVEEEPERPLPLAGAAGPSTPRFAPPDFLEVGAAAAGPGAREPEPPRVVAVVPPVRSAKRVHPVPRDTTVAETGGLVPAAPPRLRPDGPRLVRANGAPAGERPDSRVPTVRDPAVAAGSPAAARRRHAALAAQYASDAGAPVAPGASHVFDLSDGTAERLRLRLVGRGVARVTALTGTGAPLVDVTAPAAELEAEELVPAGAARLVLTSLGAGPAPLPAAAVARGLPAHAPATGWELATSLLQVAPGTLLGHGAIVLTPRPFAPPAGFRRDGPEARVPASALTAEMPGLTTLLPAGTEVVAVELDRRAAVQGLGDLAVAVEGGTLAEAQVVRSEARTTLLYPVTGTDAPHLRLSVASVRDWRLAGVVGLPGGAAGWHETLTREPGLRLVDESPTLVGDAGSEDVRVRLAVPVAAWEDER